MEVEIVAAIIGVGAFLLCSGVIYVWRAGSAFSKLSGRVEANEKAISERPCITDPDYVQEKGSQEAVLKMLGEVQRQSQEVQNHLATRINSVSNDVTRLDTISKRLTEDVQKLFDYIGKIQEKEK